jgi:hypothetical protein
LLPLEWQNVHAISRKYFYSAHSLSKYTTFISAASLPLDPKLALMNYDEQKLKVNDTLHRLELEIEGSIAFIEYKLVRDKCFGLRGVFTV